MADEKNRDLLSQEEIDALLRAVQDDAGTDVPPSAPEVAAELDGLEADVLGEIGNISFGSASTALSQILNQKVEITTPMVSVVETAALYDDLPYPLVAVFVDYTEGLQGTNALLLRARDAAVIASLMMGGDGTGVGDDLGELELSAVQEAMNQMMGSAATAMSEVFGGRVNISPPQARFMERPTDEGLWPLSEERRLVRVAFRLKIGRLVDSSIMQLVPLPFAKALVARLLGGAAEPAGDAPAPDAVAPSSSGAGKPPEAGGSPDVPEAGYGGTERSGVGRAPGGEAARPSARVASVGGEAPRSAGAGRAEAPSGGAAGAPSGGPAGARVQPVVFPDLSASAPVGAGSETLQLLLDVPLEVTVELGRTKRLIKDILSLAPGSIIELDKLAGEPVDIYVNHKRIARGEVVVIDENFGVRVTEIISPWERLGTLES
ncbi:flagellar motor switch phosphatase FliY [Hydrogenibacillus schlegelii]|uniref:flagellar motor switch phosphatase FliY n=1 Tax=Hydrogenibacillus schlegelii TaxID=1484 RepID=UPI000825ED8D|nr:flagellar motor switch phosphatase FliY [Hydrogenibacillus schlegelii]